VAEGATVPSLYPARRLVISNVIRHEFLSEVRGTLESNITIRPYRPEDLAEVVELWHDSKSKAFFYVQVQQTYKIANDTAHFQEVVSKECQVWLAEEEDEILGFIALEGDLIDQLFVKIDEQRKGIGSLLVRKAKNLSPLGLRAYTFQKNFAARSFFDKHGFRVVRSGVSSPPENEPDLEYAWSHDQGIISSKDAG